ncbi:MAG: MaoC family dehydratase [Rhizobiaceae bacterium]|nr:MaoC family dehydratase [Rhizobiaceae bacterium]
MTGRFYAFEDFEEGAALDLGSKVVTAEEIIDFASQFDMQPMHLDEAAGRASILGGLSASGWHSCCMFMRLMCDGFLLNSTSQGAPGVDYARWKRPVIAGDTLTGTSTVTAKKASSSRPGLGFVTCRHEVRNQRGEVVMELQNTGMFLTREAAGL